MQIKEVTLTNFQIKQIFEYFNKKLNEPGETAKYSWFIYKNCESLAPLYTRLNGMLYDERREPQFPEFLEKQKALIVKYADRDEQNEIVYNGNDPSITENAVEFTEENQKLLEEYSELYHKIQDKDRVNYEVFNQQVNATVTLLDLTEFPPHTPPFIVGILGY